MTKYGHIRYSLPDKQASDYAARAINILIDIQQSAPRMLPIFLAANSVLTLSGVRAYDAYHEFYGFYSDEEENRVAEALQRHGVHILPSGRSLADPTDSRLMFELLNQGGLEGLSENYHIAGDEPWPVVRSIAYSGEGFAAWSGDAERWLTALISDGTLPAAWSEDKLTAHDLRFGMLLGYPARAIESAVWLTLEETDNDGNLPHSGSVAQARISYHDAYFAAWPVYQYAAELRHDPEIQAHESLWSQILAIVYESEWHNQLQSDAAFQEIVRLVKQIEQPDEPIDLNS
jgi:hypothetical protein